MSETKWNFIVDRRGDTVSLKAIPNPDKLSEYLHQASQELTQKIMEQEQDLLLGAMATTTLEKLAALCNQEIERRNK
jgi:hypothetical protein